MAGSRRESGLKRAHFVEPRVAALLLLPQLGILLLFFFIPSIRALAQSFLLADPFGTTVHFVWFDNFTALFRSAEYRESIWVTVWFTIAQSALTIVDRRHPGLRHRPGDPPALGLQDDPAAALRDRARHRRHPVGVPVQPRRRADRACAARRRHRLEPEPERRPTR